MDERRRAPRGAVRALDEKLARRTLMGASVQRSFVQDVDGNGSKDGSVQWFETLTLRDVGRVVLRR